MNQDLLLEHFNRISDAPDAVASLRRLILDLAVRGKLVEQDADDEPARDLLKRICSEKERLVREGKLRKENFASRDDDDKGPFSLPAKWEWVRLIDILTKLTDGTHHSPPNLTEGDFKYVTAKNIKHEGVSLDEITYVSADVHREVYSRCNPEKGDILYIKDGATTGIVTINDLAEPFTMLSSVALLKLASGVYNRLVVEFLRSPFFYSQMRGFMKGAAITRVTLKRMAPALIPLPPVAEQERIVAKVDELMALCDRLEEAQRERESRRDRLTAATHHHLNSGADAEALRSHAQFFIGHLPHLTARPDQIKQLRQTILNLAVSGRLVPQSPDEEPVSHLLRRIQEDKVERAKKGNIRKQTRDQADQNGASSRHSDSKQFEVPQTWKWVPFGQIMISRDGERIPVSQEDRALRAKTYDYYGASGVIDKIHGYLFEKPLLLIGEDGANLINRSTPIAFIARGRYWVNNHAHVLDGISEDFLRFIELFINAIDLRPYVTGTAQPKMNQANMNSISVALPPEAEQNRIVAKVDELMALCDQLVSQLTTAQTEARRLLESVLHHALQASA